MLVVDFFFQAEDGIRDLTVTGVQTCALPICAKRPTCDRIDTANPMAKAGCSRRLWIQSAATKASRMRSATTKIAGSPCAERSEERRVGKECRSRWSPER